MKSCPVWNGPSLRFQRIKTLDTRTQLRVSKRKSRKRVLSDDCKSERMNFQEQWETLHWTRIAHWIRSTHKGKERKIYSRKHLSRSRKHWRLNNALSLSHMPIFREASGFVTRPFPKSRGTRNKRWMVCGDCKTSHKLRQNIRSRIRRKWQKWKKAKEISSQEWRKLPRKKARV